MSARSLSGQPLASMVAFLSGCPAFVGVDPVRLEQLLDRAEVAYLAEGGEVPEEVARSVMVVQRGALLIRDDRGRTTDLVTQGEFHTPAAGQSIEPVADTLVLLLPDESVDLAWSGSHRELAATTCNPSRERFDLEAGPVHSLMSTDLVTATGDETCRAVAERMRAHRISSVIVVGGSQPGIVTDRDLRNRLVADGGSPDDPVSKITTFPVQTLDVRLPAFEALFEMLAAGIHHMPVTDGDRLVGMITSSDLLQLQERSPLYLRKALDRSDDVDGLVAAMRTLPGTVGALLDAGSSAANIGRIVAAVSDRLTRRLISLAVADMGDPPADYTWLALGSQGRREQTLHSDQDTGLMYPDEVDDATVGWLAELAERVTAGLEACGRPRCDGGVMATEEAWRRSVSGWRDMIAGWIERPSSERLLGAEIGLDLRAVAGDMNAPAALRPEIARAAGQRVFLGRLARAAVAHRPPLGFWGNFAVERSGRHAGTFDLKAGAMLPIADLARLHTLARGGREVSTDDRLAGSVSAGQLSADLGSTLRAGYELAMRVRLDVHVARLADGLDLTNRLDPGELPPLVRSQLKETFKGVRAAQEIIESAYQIGQLGG